METPTGLVGLKELLGASRSRIVQNPSQEKPGDPETPETKISCFGAIILKQYSPPRFPLCHNNADPPGPDGKSGKPEGFGLYGGSGEEGETPFQCVQREVQREAGIEIRHQEIEVDGQKRLLPTVCGPFEDGAILCRRKPWIGNVIYTFFLEPVDDKLRRVTENDETECMMFPTLGHISMMPLAVNKARTKFNPRGIYFQHRDGLFRVLEALSFDFMELIPNLPSLFKRIEQEGRKEEIGEYVYDLLYGVLQAQGITDPTNSPRLDDEELVGSYKADALKRMAAEDEEERRRWTEN